MPRNTGRGSRYATGAREVTSDSIWVRRAPVRPWQFLWAKRQGLNPPRCAR